MSYDGGKAGAGVFQALINLMPRHEVYVEPFLGAGAVLRKKRPAPASIAIERDAAVFHRFNHQHGDEVPNLQLFHADALEILRELPGAIGGNGERRRALIYCDPPYLISTKSHKRPLYRHSLTDAEHEELLQSLLRLPCMVMVSGYWSELYAEALSEWRTASFWTTNRAGNRAQEWVWMNFPPAAELHDYRYLGQGFRQRERLKRQQKRWAAKLAKMPALERQALICAIQETI